MLEGFKKMSAAKNFHPVSLLSVVSKILEKFWNNRIAGHLERCVLCYNFHCDFRSSWSTVELLTVVSDRIARAFDRSGATQVVAPLDITKAFDRVWHAGFLHKRKCYGISDQIFGLISFFLSNRRFREVLDGKSSQEHPVNAGVAQGSIPGPTLFLIYIMTFLMMLSVILLSMLMIPLSILSEMRPVICGKIWIGFWIWTWSTRHCGLV